MKTTPGLLLITLLTMVMGACSYSDTEIYYVEPVPNDSALMVLTTSLDTVGEAIITDSLLFTYRAVIEGGKLYFTEASIDNFILHQHETDYDPDTITGPFVLSDSFWIRRDMPVLPGINSMLFTLYYSSNTNSLADILGVEANIFEEEYIIDMGGIK
ncbi:MAG: hypothetical protein GY790_21125 [Bacteroidetes bacterium]|nr:hypothetical protein [Bacteroidota bacterium]